MKYAKLLDGYPSYAPNPIHIDGCWIGNPSAQTYLNAGYKPVIYYDKPDDPGEHCAWVETWSEDNTNIYRSWELVEVPISDEEALVKYVNETTGKNDETLIQATESLVCFIEGGE